MDSVIDFSIVETKQNIDLAVSPTDTSSIQFDIVEQSTNVNLDIAVKGQKGDTAVIEVSQDADNIITFGTDGKLYAAPHQFASTQW
jgi:hypothetical protein